MRAVIQRVSESSVLADGEHSGAIGTGLLVLLGIEGADTEEDAEWLARKIASLRIFNDEQGQMNLDLSDVGGDILVISQFTLHAKTKKGTRPSYIRAAKPPVAIPMYKRFVELLDQKIEGRVETGEFGADMKVSLVNDGPVTIWIDTKNRE